MVQNLSASGVCWVVLDSCARRHGQPSTLDASVMEASILPPSSKPTSNTGVAERGVMLTIAGAAVASWSVSGGRPRWLSQPLSGGRPRWMSSSSHMILHEWQISRCSCEYAPNSRSLRHSGYQNGLGRPLSPSNPSATGAARGVEEPTATMGATSGMSSTGWPALARARADGASEGELRCPGMTGA